MIEKSIEKNDNIMLESIKPLSAVIIVSIIYRAMKPSVDEIKIDEGLMYAFKLAIYGFLAFYIYWNFYINDFKEIILLTFFSFLLFDVYFSYYFFVLFMSFMI